MPAVIVVMLVLVVVLVVVVMVVCVGSLVWVCVFDAAVAVAFSVERLVGRGGGEGHGHEGTPGPVITRCATVVT